MIPEAAVEAAAVAWVGKQVWQDCDHAWRADYLDRARAALEAAAPHIRAQALEEAAEAWQVRMDTIGRGSVEAKTFMQVLAVAERPTP